MFVDLNTMLLLFLLCSFHHKTRERNTFLCSLCHAMVKRFVFVFAWNNLSEMKFMFSALKNAETWRLGNGKRSHGWHLRMYNAASQHRCKHTVEQAQKYCELHMAYIPCWDRKKNQSTEKITFEQMNGQFISLRLIHPHRISNSKQKSYNWVSALRMGVYECMQFEDMKMNTLVEL